jgi:hypothetical protein
MTILSAPKILEISQSKDQKQAIIDAVGDLAGIDVFSDLVLLGTYIRPEKTTGGIIRPKEVVQEDEHQGKVGLVLKKGPIAYGDWEDDKSLGQNAVLHTWVVYQAANTWKFQLNGVACSIVPYERLRLRVDDPTKVF